MSAINKFNIEIKIILTLEMHSRCDGRDVKMMTSKASDGGVQSYQSEDTLDSKEGQSESLQYMQYL